MRISRLICQTDRGLARARSFSVSSGKPDGDVPVASEKKKTGIMALVKEHGVPFLIYWTGVWACTGVGTYFVLEVTGVDSVSFIRSLGIDLDVSPQTGNIGVAVAINEMMEVVRLPVCIATFKPMHNMYKEWKKKRD